LANNGSKKEAVDAAMRWATEPVTFLEAVEYIFEAHKYTADYNAALRVKETHHR